MSTSKDALAPREAGKWIAEHSEDVKISQAGVKSLAKHIFENMRQEKPSIDMNQWKSHQLYPKNEDEAAVNWVFFTDLLNFSFWSEDPAKKFVVHYGGKDWTGYLSLCAVLNRAIDEGIPLSEPSYYSTITKEQLDMVFRSDSQTPMPLLEERLAILHQAGKVLLEKYDGTFVNMIRKCDRSAQSLLELLLEEFPSFRDVAEYKGRTVALYKRVQILISDVWACCAGKGFGEFNDIDSMTMFADYRIPQALVWYEVLQYSDELMQVLKKNTMMQSGERLEVEIRGCTIRAVDLVVEEVRQLMATDPAINSKQRMNAIVVDHYLWDTRRKYEEETKHIPFHRVRCVYY